LVVGAESEIGICRPQRGLRGVAKVRKGAFQALLIGGTRAGENLALVIHIYRMLEGAFTKVAVAGLADLWKVAHVVTADGVGDDDTRLSVVRVGTRGLRETVGGSLSHFKRHAKTISAIAKALIQCPPIDTQSIMYAARVEVGFAAALRRLLAHREDTLQTFVQGV
jgi:hypothetical protein